MTPTPAELRALADDLNFIMSLDGLGPNAQATVQRAHDTIDALAAEREAPPQPEAPGVDLEALEARRLRALEAPSVQGQRFEHEWRKSNESAGDSELYCDHCDVPYTYAVPGCAVLMRRALSARGEDTEPRPYATVALNILDMPAVKAKLAEYEEAVAGLRVDAELGRALREAREAWGDPGLYTTPLVTGHNTLTGNWVAYSYSDADEMGRPRACSGPKASELEALRAAAAASGGTPKVVGTGKEG